MSQSEAVLETFKDFFEQREQLHIATERDDRFGGRDPKSFKVNWHIRSHCMEPMDRPRLLFGGAINVGSERRDHQQLVFLHCMGLSGEFAPATPLGAVNKDRFPAAALARASMTSCPWIIARIRRN